MKLRWMTRLGWVAPALVSINAPAFTIAQTPTGFIIRDIRIEGLEHIEPGTVFANIPLRVGDRFSDEKASETIRALYATGLFNDIRISTDADVVVVHVGERPAIGTIDFAGIYEFDKDNLN